MGHIRTDAIDWRNGKSFSFFDVDVGAMFKAGALFTARGFSYSTIKALVRAGIDAPERLLFADGANLLLISGLDEQAFKEIAGYRRQFAGMQQAQTSALSTFRQMRREAQLDLPPIAKAPHRVAIDQPRAPERWIDDPSARTGRSI
jgi:hypothetical protein